MTVNSHVNELAADHRILCYADTSNLLGGNQFNENDRIIAGKDELRLEEERLRKKLLGKLDSVWYTGFSKDKDGGRPEKFQGGERTVIIVSATESDRYPSNQEKGFAAGCTA